MPLHSMRGNLKIREIEKFRSKRSKGIDKKPNRSLREINKKLKSVLKSRNRRELRP